MELLYLLAEDCNRLGIQGDIFYRRISYKFKRRV